jgi:hypothetical protein
VPCTLNLFYYEALSHNGNFKLDGGAMFGVVPKTIWNKTNPADANNPHRYCRTLFAY